MTTLPPGAARIEVWLQDDGVWRWRYRDPGEGTDLLSNESYSSRDGAVHSAGLAYPGVPMVERRAPAWSLREVRSLAKSAGLRGVVAMVVALMAAPVVGMARALWRVRRALRSGSKRAR